MDTIDLNLARKETLALVLAGGIPFKKFDG